MVCPPRRAARLAVARPAVRAVALPAALPAPSGESLGLRLGSWLLRLLRDCVFLLLCSWCVRQLLD